MKKLNLMILLYHKPVARTKYWLGIKLIIIFLFFCDFLIR